MIDKIVRPSNQTERRTHDKRSGPQHFELSTISDITFISIREGVKGNHREFFLTRGGQRRRGTDGETKLLTKTYLLPKAWGMRCLENRQSRTVRPGTGGTNAAISGRPSGEATSYLDTKGKRNEGDYGGRRYKKSKTAARHRLKGSNLKGHGTPPS